MGYMWFDESIRDNGNFIVGALVYCHEDISQHVQDEWRDTGLNPMEFEFKSSAPKASDQSGRDARERLREILKHTRVGLAICPTSHRKDLGVYGIALAKQLVDSKSVPNEAHCLFMDQGIIATPSDILEAEKYGIKIYPDQDSRAVAGIQLADLASHSLGGMLLETMGLISKTIRVGEESGYDLDTKIEIGLELWASLRCLLFQSPEPIRALIGNDVSSYPVFQVQSYGLYIAPSCSEELRNHAISRFGENYLGCLH